MSAVAQLTDIRTLLKLSGYKVLIRVNSKEERKQTAGGLYVPDALAADEAHATMTGVVMALGPDAYSDPKRFPSGPWCKEGDAVVFRAYAGHPLKLRGSDYRIVNDDTIEAVTTCPDEIGRI